MKTTFSIKSYARRDRKNARSWKVEGSGPEGKRVRKFFPTRAAAQKFAADANTETASIGWLAMGLSEQQRVEAAKCYAALAPSGISLTTAVHGYLIQKSQDFCAMTVAEVTREIMTNKALLGLSDSHLRTTRCHFRKFVKTYGTRKITTITRRELSAWLHSQSLPSSTFRAVRTHLNMLFRHCVTEGYIRENPAAKIPVPKQKAQPPGILTIAAVKKLLEIPHEADAKWTTDIKKFHADWWAARIARQKEIDASIAAKAEFEYLYDKPFEDKKKVRVAGPFTVESLSPHRTMIVGADDELIDPSVNEAGAEKQSFSAMILDNLKLAGVQQAHKADKITFTGLIPIAGKGLVCAVGTYREGDADKRAGIFIGPEFGTVQRADLVAAARECADLGFDVEWLKAWLSHPDIPRLLEKAETSRFHIKLGVSYEVTWISEPEGFRPCEFLKFFQDFRRPLPKKT